MSGAYEILPTCSEWRSYDEGDRLTHPQRKNAVGMLRMIATFFLPASVSRCIRKKILSSGALPSLESSPSQIVKYPSHEDTRDAITNSPSTLESSRASHRYLEFGHFIATCDHIQFDGTFNSTQY